jgi:hypothetical protein
LFLAVATQIKAGVLVRIPLFPTQATNQIVGISSGKNEKQSLKQAEVETIRAI